MISIDIGNLPFGLAISNKPAEWILISTTNKQMDERTRLGIDVLLVTNAGHPLSGAAPRSARPRMARAPEIRSRSSTSKDSDQIDPVARQELARPGIGRHVPQSGDAVRSDQLRQGHHATCSVTRRCSECKDGSM